MPESCQDLIDIFGEEVVDDLTAYNTKRLEEHNAKRALHADTPALETNLDLACQAMWWALSHLERDGDLADTAEGTVHYYADKGTTPLDPAQGENVAVRRGLPFLAENDRWEEEGWYDN